MGDHDGFRVVIAGAGIAGMEAALALRELLGSAASVTVVAPEKRFQLRPLVVSEPFGFGPTPYYSLERLVADAGAELRLGRVAAVDDDRRVVTLADGEELAYAAALVAMGVRAEGCLPGAITYDGRGANAPLRRVVDGAEEGTVRSLAFAVPATVRWGLPIYELALLTAARLAAAGASVQLTLATAEAEPLAMLGARASEGLRDMLDRAGIELMTSSAPAAVREGHLQLVNGESVEADAVIAAPRLEAPAIPGLPQGPHGFIGTDQFMRVEGSTRTWAAGDATWFPIKQGGIAAQQADAAARSIAHVHDPEIEPRPFTPVLRAAMFTGGGPRYLRSRVGARDQSSAFSAAPLWWPPAKVAARRLAPYLAGKGVIPSPSRQSELEDVEPLHGEDIEETAADHREAVDMALKAADADARWHDYEGALRWLDVAEGLDLALPGIYAAKREAWRELTGR